MSDGKDQKRVTGFFIKEDLVTLFEYLEQQYQVQYIWLAAYDVNQQGKDIKVFRSWKDLESVRSLGISRTGHFFENRLSISIAGTPFTTKIIGSATDHPSLVIDRFNGGVVYAELGGQFSFKGRDFILMSDIGAANREGTNAAGIEMVQKLQTYVRQNEWPKSSNPKVLIGPHAYNELQEKEYILAREAGVQKDNHFPSPGKPVDYSHYDDWYKEYSTWDKERHS